eukprot:6195170-Pleurochrysis_carterae.AAC.14
MLGDRGRHGALINVLLGALIRIIYVIQRKRRIVHSVAGESGDAMAPLIHHSPSNIDTLPER